MTYDGYYCALTDDWKVMAISENRWHMKHYCSKNKLTMFPMTLQWFLAELRKGVEQIATSHMFA